MRFSIVHEGNVLDVNYKRMKEFPDGVVYLVYLDDAPNSNINLLGSIFKMRKHSWTAVVTGLNTNGVRECEGFRKIDGFGSRYDATAYLLRALGYWRE